MNADFKEIIQSLLFQKIIKEFLGKENFEVVIRPACFFICLKNENTKLIKRIIIFPPHGFTSDEINLLNPHPETRKAKVKILGKINPIKKGFMPLTKEVKFNFSLARNIPTEKTSAYAKFSEKYCGSQFKSWKSWFYVVKKNGWGNFHNLINLSNEWIIALLEKELVDQKKINIKSHLKKLSEAQMKKLQLALIKIKQSGDKIFNNKTLIAEILKLPPKILVPILIQMLNIQETAKHEPCTFFAFLLKIAKKNRNLILREVKRAVELKLAPYYYLEDLSKKLKKL